MTMSKVTSDVIATVRAITKDLDVHLDPSLCSVWHTAAGKISMVVSLSDVPPSEAQRSLTTSAVMSQVLGAYPGADVQVHMPHPVVGAGATPPSGLPRRPTLHTVMEANGVKKYTAAANVVLVRDFYVRVLRAYPWKEISAMTEIAATMIPAVQRAGLVDTDKALEYALKAVDHELLAPVEPTLTTEEVRLLMEEVVAHEKVTGAPKSLLRVYEVVYEMGCAGGLGSRDDEGARLVARVYNEIFEAAVA